MKKEKVYALYEGDKFLTLGTLKEIANELGINVKSVLFYGTPAYLKRTKGNGKILICVED